MEVAELIQLLETSYGDRQAKSRARTRLETFRYNLNLDIARFLGQFNALTEKAGTPLDQLKEVLWEHLPPEMTVHLYTWAKDPNTNYEAFCGHVTDIAYAQKVSRTTRNTPPRRTPVNRNPANTTNPARPQGPPPLRRLSDSDRQHLMNEGRCLRCRQQGHIAVNCPKTIPQVSQVIFGPEQGEETEMEPEQEALEGTSENE